MSLPPCVLWFDPGKMTGMAVYEPRADPQFRVTEVDFQTAGAYAEGLCLRYVSMIWIGWERYGISAKHPQDDAHHAIEMIGVIKHYALKYQARILTPAQQHTPDRLDQQRLKAVGWWLPGHKDAQSAAAHMLRWMQRENEVPPRERELLAAIRR